MKSAVLLCLKFAAAIAGLCAASAPVRPAAEEMKTFKVAPGYRLVPITKPHDH